MSTITTSLGQLLRAKLNEAKALSHFRAFLCVDEGIASMFNESASLAAWVDAHPDGSVETVLVKGHHAHRHVYGVCVSYRDESCTFIYTTDTKEMANIVAQCVDDHDYDVVVDTYRIH